MTSAACFASKRTTDAVTPGTSPFQNLAAGPPPRQHFAQPLAPRVFPTAAHLTVVRRDVTASLPLRRGGRNATVEDSTVLGRRRMTIAVLTLLVLLLAGSDAAGGILSVEILNRTPLDTGDYSLAIETDQFGIIFLTGK